MKHVRFFLISMMLCGPLFWCCEGDIWIYFNGIHVAQQVKLTEDAVDNTAGDVPCYKIETPAATYYLEKEGFGLSSMLDPDGIDWISFDNTPGSKSNGEYRGFPNAVHKQDGNFFHPKNAETEVSTSKVVTKNPGKVTIEGLSENKNWRCRFDFYPTFCTFTMSKMAPRRKYWILYEGTPGGQCDDTDWWMTSAIKEKTVLTKTHEGDIPAPEWIVFGDAGSDRVIFLYHHEDDTTPDRFYQIRKEMTVFGFGRDQKGPHLTDVPHSFSIGFAETTDHAGITQYLSTLPR